MNLPDSINGSFSNVRLLKVGGQGRTFRASSNTSGESVVIKELDLHGSDPAKSLELFRREARTLSALSHDGIPRYIDDFHVVDGGEHRYFLVQHYVEGPTLEEIIESDQPLASDELSEMLVALLQILQYLHSHDPPVLHRDIKPANIITREDGTPVLVDFGAAQRVRRETASNTTIVGTMGYMAPEQFTGRAVPASDIYGLGSTFVHLVTRKHPIDLLGDDLKLDLASWRDIDPEFIAILERMTAVSVEDRFPNAVEVLAVLDERDSIYDYVPPTNALMLTRLPPRGSTLSVQRTVGQLRVEIPPRGRPLLLAELAVFSLCVLSLAISGWAHQLVFYVMGTLAVLALLGSWIQVKSELHRFTRTRIWVDEDGVKVELKRLRRKQYELPHPVGVDVVDAAQVVEGASTFSKALELRNLKSYRLKSVTLGHLLSATELDWVRDELESVLEGHYDARTMRRRLRSRDR